MSRRKPQCECGQPAIVKVKFSVGTQYKGAGSGSLALCRLHFAAWIRDEYGQEIQFLDNDLDFTDCERTLLRIVRRHGAITVRKAAEHANLSEPYAQKLFYRLYQAGFLSRWREHRGGRGHPHYIYRMTEAGRRSSPSHQ